jgi:hypothetical protein
MKLGFLLLLFLIGLNLLAKIKRMKVKFYLFNIGILNFIVTYLNKFFIPLIFLKNLLEKS